MAISCGKSVRDPRSSITRQKYNCLGTMAMVITLYEMFAQTMFGEYMMWSFTRLPTLTTVVRSTVLVIGLPNQLPTKRHQELV
jgi:hypothetical protein